VFLFTDPTATVFFTFSLHDALPILVADYVYGNMYGKSDPVVFYCIPQFTSLLYLRTKAHANTEQALAKIEAVIKKHNPAYPFERSEEHTSELQSRENLVCRLLLEKK